MRQVASFSCMAASTVVLALCSPLSAQTAWRDTPIGRRMAAFLDAYNTGDEDALRGFTRANYDPSLRGEPRVNATAAYWRSVYREFGPVIFHQVFQQSDNALEIWARGTISRAWVTFLLEATSDSSRWVTSGGVGRGIVPPDQGRFVPRVRQDGIAGHVRSYLQELEKAELFSGVVLVAHHGQPIVARAMGLAIREHGVPNREDTRFDLASVSKTFTAIAVARLVERGALSYDDPISKYLPDYPRQIGDRVTLYHLLTHRSGIELDFDATFNEQAQRARSVSELLRVHMEHLPKLPNFAAFTLPTGFDYSNEGYDLAGAILERVTERRFHDIIRDEVLTPAGMNETAVFEIDAIMPRRAQGYTSRGRRGSYPSGPPRTNTLWVSHVSQPSGGYYATASDLLRFANALFSSRLLSRERTAELFAPKGDTVEYGYGFAIKRLGTTRRVGHAGGLLGASARLDHYPELGYTVIALANFDWVANNVADHIAEVISGIAMSP